MSKLIKLELDSRGIRNLLRSQEAEAICSEYADRAINTLGEGYESSTYVGKGRVNVSVAAVTHKAIAENNKDNRVIKAVLAK